MDNHNGLPAGAGGVSSCAVAPASAPDQRLTARPLLDLSTLDSDQPPAEARPDYVLPYLSVGECALLAGQPGAGKSWLALQMCASVAIGRDLAGSDACPEGLGIHGDGAAVTYIELEDGPAIVWHRLHALYARMQPTEQAQLKADLTVVVSPGRPLDVMTTTGRAELRALAEGRRLVVVDSLACSHRADENDTRAMADVATVFTETATETGAAMIIVHHVSKAAVRDGMQDMRMAARGASSFAAAMRMQSVLVGMTNADAKARRLRPQDIAGYVRWCIPVQHHGPQPADIWLQKDCSGFHAVRLTDVPKSSKPATKGRKGTPSPKTMRTDDEDDGSW